VLHGQKMATVEMAFEDIRSQMNVIFLKERHTSALNDDMNVKLRVANKDIDRLTKDLNEMTNK
jgi:hypothetical protein